MKYLSLNKKYIGIIRDTLIAYLIGGCLLYWGLLNNGWFRIIGGGFILFIFTSWGIKRICYYGSLGRWLQDNRGKLVFFYPTSNKIQGEIEKEIIPVLPKGCLRVYYKGPTFIGDIRQSIILKLLSGFDGVEVNSPSIYKVVKNGICIDSLVELQEILVKPVDAKEIITKIERVANG